MENFEGIYILLRNSLYFVKLFFIIEKEKEGEV